MNISVQTDSAKREPIFIQRLEMFPPKEFCELVLMYELVSDELQDLLYAEELLRTSNDPVRTKRRFNVVSTSMALERRHMNVNATLCSAISLTDTYLKV